MSRHDFPTNTKRKRLLILRLRGKTERRKNPGNDDPKSRDEDHQKKKRERKNFSERKTYLRKLKLSNFYNLFLSLFNVSNANNQGLLKVSYLKILNKLILRKKLPDYKTSKIKMKFFRFSENLKINKIEVPRIAERVESEYPRVIIPRAHSSNPTWGTGFCENKKKRKNPGV